MRARCRSRDRRYSPLSVRDARTPTLTPRMFAQYQLPSRASVSPTDEFLRQGFFVLVQINTSPCRRVPETLLCEAQLWPCAVDWFLAC